MSEYIWNFKHALVVCSWRLFRGGLLRGHRRFLELSRQFAF